MGACARNMQSDSAEIKPAQCCIQLVFHLTENSSSLDTVRGQLCRWGDQAMAWTSQGSIPDGRYEFCSSQTRPDRLYRPPRVSCADYRGFLSAGVRYRLPPSSAELKNERSYASISPLSDFGVYTRTNAAFGFYLNPSSANMHAIQTANLWDRAALGTVRLVSLPAKHQ